MSKIRYLVHYDVNDDEGRVYALSAVNKVNYITEVFAELGIDIKIVSASLTSKKKYSKRSRIKLSNGIELVKLSAFKSKGRIGGYIAYIWNVAALFVWMLFCLNKEDILIVYHSLMAIPCALRWAKRIKGFRLIMEVEEVYSDVVAKYENKRNKELDYLSIADAYIFPTLLLNQEINTKRKPYCIIHGTYQAEADRNVSFDDGKIHAVYAGTFDPRKGGAVAVAAAERLPENYHMHIIGFGSDRDTEYIKNRIKEINKKSRASVTYDGQLSGEAYIEFLQKCHIGMSTQNPDADFNATSFPSKILSYMANGLRVVTVRIPAIESSAVGNDLYYYEKQTPQAIADAVMDVNFSDGYDGRKKIGMLDKIFKQEMIKLIEDLIGNEG